MLASTSDAGATAHPRAIPRTGQRIPVAVCRIGRPDGISRNTWETRAIHPPRDRSSRREFLRASLTVPAALVGALAACDVREYAYRHGAKRRLSLAAGNTGGVYYVYGGAIARVVGAHLPRVEMTAEVTGGSVDNLNF